MPRYLIVGGVAGGMSAAARLRRLDESAEIVVFEKGRYISYENSGLPYYVGNVIKGKDALQLRTPEFCRTHYNIDVRIRHEVLAIQPGARTVTVKNLDTGDTTDESYDRLLLSPGSKPIIPPLPGIDLPRVLPVHNIPDTDKVKALIESESIKHVTLVGGGYIGVELADNLDSLGLEVHIVERLPHTLGVMDAEMAALVEQRLRAGGVHLHLGAGVSGFEATASGLRIGLDGGQTLETELAILVIGIRPNAELAKSAGLTIGDCGGIKVDAGLRTSDPHIYAVGDAIEVYHPVVQQYMPIALGGPANKQGRIAADNMVRGDVKTYDGTLGTSIAKVMDLNVAVTGANERLLERAGMPYETVVFHSYGHATYFPGAGTLSIKLLFSPQDGRLYGGQIVGQDGVQSGIDLLSFAIQHGKTVHDLQKFEHAYAPAFSWEKDPINMAGDAAENVLRGLVRQVQPGEADAQTAGGALCVDVREPGEFETGTLPGAVNYPLSTLRDRAGELPPDRPILLCSLTGKRSYFAARVLAERGLDARNLSGGLMTYRALHDVN
jgi:NADPH-dependent 2,4-dienoyl-CoA reductase/sulfur reductase-like enzyme/rhodanese-related sulfurtransferase